MHTFVASYIYCNETNNNNNDDDNNNIFNSFLYTYRILSFSPCITHLFMDNTKNIIKINEIVKLPPNSNRIQSAQSKDLRQYRPWLSCSFCVYQFNEYLKKKHIMREDQTPTVYLCKYMKLRTVSYYCKFHCSFHAKNYQVLAHTTYFCVQFHYILREEKRVNFHLQEQEVV